MFGDPTIADTWVEDCSVAMTNMHLAADALGLGSCWVQARMRTAVDGTPSSDYVGRILDAPEGLSLKRCSSWGTSASIQLPIRLPISICHL